MSTLVRKLAAFAAGTAAAGVFSVASAQEEAAVPPAEPKVLPDICMPFKENAGRAPQFYDSALRALRTAVRGYSGWALLEERMGQSGAVEGFCALSRGEGSSQTVMFPLFDRKAIGINVYAASPFGATLHDPRKLTAEIASNASPHHALNMVYAATLVVINPPEHPMTLETDDADAQVMLSILSYAAAAAEQTLYAAEHFMKTGDDRLLTVSAETLESYKKVIDNFAAEMKAQRDLGQMNISEASRNDLRHAIANVALHSPELRQSMMAAIIQPTIQYSQMGAIDPTAVLLYPLDKEGLQAALARFPGKDYESLPIVANYKGYWKAQGDKDPAAPMLANLDLLRDRYKAFKQRMEQQQAPKAN